MWFRRQRRARERLRIKLAPRGLRGGANDELCRYPWSRRAKGVGWSLSRIAGDKRRRSAWFCIVPGRLPFMPRVPIHIPLFPSGVGSTQHADADQAVDDVLGLYGRMPFWPQLPNRAAVEMMIPQFGLSLPDARWDDPVLHWSGDILRDPTTFASLPPPERAAGLHVLIERMKATAPADRPPVIKGQLVGPLTLSSAMCDADGQAPHSALETLRWLGQVIGQMGAAQALALQRSGAAVVIVIDEPCLAAVGEPALPISWRDAVDVLRATLEPIQRTGALAGIHSCEPADWTQALRARPDLIHFDAQEGRIDDFLEHKPALREHVARGGYLGWGLWPTATPGGVFDPKAMQYYVARAAREISFVDSSVGLIFKRSMISGVCGTVGLSVTEERQMASDLEALSMGIRQRYWIAATTDVDPDHPLT